MKPESGQETTCGFVPYIVHVESTNKMIKWEKEILIQCRLGHASHDPELHVIRYSI